MKVTIEDDNGDVQVLDNNETLDACLKELRFQDFLIPCDCGKIVLVRNTKIINLFSVSCRSCDEERSEGWKGINLSVQLKKKRKLFF